MDREDREKIEKIVRDRRWAHERLTHSDSGVYQAFLKMEAAAYSDAALSKMCKELIAIGISLVLSCESCLEWHIHQALESGAEMRLWTGNHPGSSFLRRPVPESV